MPLVRHVVLVLVDAMRADRLGAYGSSVETPEMDRLASAGVVFANACAQAPSTRPSVSSLMTGLYPSQHGIVDRVVNEDNGVITVVGLDPSLPMLAEALAESGVETAAFLGGNANVKPVFGLTRGFQHVDWQPTTDGRVLVDGFTAWASRRHEGPTFSYLHFMDVHHPLPMEIIPSRLDDGLDLSTVDQTADQLVECYDAAVRLVDSHIGGVVRALEDAGMADETLIVVTADHGEELLEHGAMLAHGRTLYRELIQVPVILRSLGEPAEPRVIEEPVQLVDLFPTVLDALGRAPLELPGRSLLPALAQGGSLPDRPAFSELHRRDLYAQAVTTRTHQLIVSYLFEELENCDPQDLREGDRVKVKGQPLQGSGFHATKVGLSHDTAVNLRGTVDAVEGEGGRKTVTVLGVAFCVDDETQYSDLEDRPVPLSSLLPGDRLSVALVADGAGWRAARLAQRKPGGKSKLEGPVAAVTRDGDRYVLDVLGIEVSVPADTSIKAQFRDKSFTHRKTDALSRMMDADFVDRRVELFDLRSDPTQSRSLVDDRPDVAQDLEGRLAAWTEWMASKASTSTTSVDVDPETLDQLRRMGYVE